jgi:ribonuclease-3
MTVDLSSLRAGLIHKSYCNEHPGCESNERLEFLGDSVLSLIISDRLYLLFPGSPEGELTSRRSNLVQTISLAKKAKDLGLDKALLLSRGEEDSGGRQNTSLLADTFEAVLGTIYLERGVSEAEKFIAEIFPDEELIADIQLKDPKSLLQEKSQAMGWGTPVYKLKSTTGPDHAKLFEIEVFANDKVLGSGSGSSKQRAEAVAATTALVNFPQN